MTPWKYASGICCRDKELPLFSVHECYRCHKVIHSFCFAYKDEGGKRAMWDVLRPQWHPKVLYRSHNPIFYPNWTSSNRGNTNWIELRICHIKRILVFMLLSISLVSNDWFKYCCFSITSVGIIIDVRIPIMTSTHISVPFDRYRYIIISIGQ